MEKKLKNSENRISARNLAIIWIVGLAGQLCWNVENQWFNTFVYAKAGPYPQIIAWMTAVSATATAFATFFFGTLSDRIGKRRPFIMIGYILWGLFTIFYGTTEFLPKNSFTLLAVMLVGMDAMMSFFGSMGNDIGFNSWTTDITTGHNRGQLGAAVATQPVLATIVGTVIGGMLIEKLGYFSFFIAMGVLVIAIGIFGFFTMKEGPLLHPVRDEKGFWHQFFSVFNFKTFVKNRELFYVFFIMSAYFICFNFYFAHIGNYFIYTLGYPEGDAGLIQGVGLIIAVLATIPASRFINKGRHSTLVVTSVVLSILGLLILFISGQSIVLIEAGIILAGAGYVLVLQTTTAWVKNLYPEDSRGQYEGVRIVFFVLIPMILGPAAASVMINNWGVDVIIDGVSGKSPSSVLFLAAAILISITLIPTHFAQKEKMRIKK